MNNLSGMLLLIKNIIIFLSPFGCIFIINYLIDPFNINRLVQLPLAKEEIVPYFDERLWKLNTFMHHPKPCIILGDSRAAILSENKINQISTYDVANVSLSGTTLQEIIDTFWFITKQINLKKVFFGINFDRFNDWQKASGVQQAIKTIQNPLSHYIQPTTVKATWHLIYHYFFSGNKCSQAPPMNKDQFWQQQITEVDRGYQRYITPIYGMNELKKISLYCKKNEIELSFIILPTHIDLQQRIATAQLQHEEQHFKNFLAGLACIGTVYDFDQPTALTQNKIYFNDPKHCTTEAGNKIIEVVWNPHPSKLKVNELLTTKLTA